MTWNWPALPGDRCDACGAEHQGRCPAIRRRVTAAEWPRYKSEQLTKWWIEYLCNAVDTARSSTDD